MSLMSWYLWPLLSILNSWASLHSLLVKQSHTSAIKVQFYDFTFLSMHYVSINFPVRLWNQSGQWNKPCNTKIRSKFNFFDVQFVYPSYFRGELSSLNHSSSKTDWSDLHKKILELYHIRKLVIKLIMSQKPPKFM